MPAGAGDAKKGFLLPGIEAISLAELDWHTFISEKRGYIYINNPKAACSLIKQALWANELQLSEQDPDYPHDISLVHNKSQNPLLSPSQLECCQLERAWKYFIKFAFVRHPQTRLLSAYLDKIYRGASQKRHILKVLGKSEKDLTEFVSFEDFVDAVGQQSAVEMNPHWRMQSDLIRVEFVQYDFIGRFENVGNDLEFILRWLYGNGRKYRLRDREFSRKGWADHRTHADCRLKEFYGRRTVDRVYQIFKKDFEWFNYKPMYV